MDKKKKNQTTTDSVRATPYLTEMKRRIRHSGTLIPSTYNTLSYQEQGWAGRIPDFNAKDIEFDVELGDPEYYNFIATTGTYSTVVGAFALLLRDKIGPEKSDKLLEASEKLWEFFIRDQDYSPEDVAFNAGNLNGDDGIEQHEIDDINNDLDELVDQLYTELAATGSIIFPAGYMGSLEKYGDPTDLEKYGEGHAIIARIEYEGDGAFHYTVFDAGGDEFIYTKEAVSEHVSPDFNPAGLMPILVTHTRPLLDSSKETITEVLRLSLIKNNTHMMIKIGDDEEIKNDNYTTVVKQLNNLLGDHIDYRPGYGQYFGNCTSRTVREYIYTVCEEIGVPEVAEAIRAFVINDGVEIGDKYKPNLYRRLNGLIDDYETKDVRSLILEAIQEESTFLGKDVELRDDLFEIADYDPELRAVYIKTDNQGLENILSDIKDKIEEIKPDISMNSYHDQQGRFVLAISHEDLEDFIYQLRDTISDISVTEGYNLAYNTINDKDMTLKQKYEALAEDLPELFSVDHEGDIYVTPPYKLVEQPLCVQKLYHDLMDFGFIEERISDHDLFNSAHLVNVKGRKGNDDDGYNGPGGGGTSLGPAF